MAKKHTLKQIKIKKLFGYKNISIPIKDDVLILIGENGLGKTTILNIIYSALAGKLEKLNDLPFESLEITFENSSSAILIRKDISIGSEIEDGYLRNRSVHSYDSRRYRRYLTSEQISNIDNYLLDLPYNEKKRDFNILYDIRNKFDLEIPIGLIEDYIENFYRNKTKIKFLKIIRENINQEVIYFPTYRRIEEDLKNLGVNNKDIESSNSEVLIQFGMDDVNRRISAIINQIKDIGFKGYTKITGKVITQSLNDTSSKVKKTIDPEILKIVFARTSEYIQEEDRKLILEKIATGEIEKNQTLYILLLELTELYKEQEVYDQSVSKFAETCNQYLFDKEIKYDEATLEVSVNNEHGDQIGLNKLSSGEKQIVSIFSRLYLENPLQKKLILFDEPELSLSLAWQERLLPDIMDSNMCEFLIATTHSPFIFTNKLDKKAKLLKDLIK